MSDQTESVLFEGSLSDENFDETAVFGSFPAGQLDAPKTEAAVSPVSYVPPTSLGAPKNRLSVSDFGETPNPSATFQIKLSSPSKIDSGLLSTHTEYTVDVHTTLNHYKSSHFTVNRRFSDFVWLREQLAENNKGYLIPPLPEKAILNRFNAEFVEYRRRELERFLKRVVDHHHLSQSADLQNFFESEKSEKESAGGSKILSFLSGASASPAGNTQDVDPWFDSKKNYIGSLETHFQMLTKNLSIYIKKKREAAAAFAEFGVSCSLLASAEADHDSVTSSSFNRFADIITQGNELEEKRMQDETGVFEENLRDYLRVLVAVKEMLAVRQEKLNAFHNATKQVEQKKERVEKSKGNAKFESEYTAAQLNFTKSELDFNEVSARARAELQHFEANKLKDIKALLVKYTQININYELQMADFWKILLSDL